MPRPLPRTYPCPCSEATPPLIPLPPPSAAWAPPPSLRFAGLRLGLRCRMAGEWGAGEAAGCRLWDRFRAAMGVWVQTQRQLTVGGGSNRRLGFGVGGVYPSCLRDTRLTLVSLCLPGWALTPTSPLRVPAGSPALSECVPGASNPPQASRMWPRLRHLTPLALQPQHRLTLLGSRESGICGSLSI